jgi:hypothetical protein
VRSLDGQGLARTLAALSPERPIFHSEADFQHALAWRIHDDRPAAAVRLELPREVGGRRAHVDIWVVDGGERIAIELKYFTRKIDVVVSREHFQLRDQAAQDLGRYDVLRDLVRIETLVAAGEADRGYVIALTNDSSYWKGPTPLSSPNYEAFRLMEARDLGGLLTWGPATGPGTMKGRETPIVLRDRYRCNWADYSDLASTASYMRFRYLLFEHPTDAHTRPSAP